MNKKIAFSGIQPTGIIHIGNYLGAIKNWVEIQEQFASLFCIVDLHAITVKQDPKKLSENTYKTIATILAAGIDPKKSTIFIQSHIHEHCELAWILNTITHMGELSRMTQFKEKAYGISLMANSKRGNKNDMQYAISDKQNSVGVGLFDYPVLMAADILLYNTDIVPVGEDQKQHVELARDLAQRFNNTYRQTFVVPEPIIRKEGARIMGLDNPNKKMSKSAESEYNYIALTDDADTIRRKISKAVTDSSSDIKFDPKRLGLCNLLNIYSLMKEVSPPSLEKKYIGKGYGDFKKDLAELLVGKLKPFQTKYNKLITDKKYLMDVIKDGAKSARPIAAKTLKDVKEKIGLI